MLLNLIFLINSVFALDPIIVGDLPGTPRNMRKCGGVFSSNLDPVRGFAWNGSRELHGRIEAAKDLYRIALELKDEGQIPGLDIIVVNDLRVYSEKFSVQGRMLKEMQDTLDYSGFAGKDNRKAYTENIEQVLRDFEAMREDWISTIDRRVTNIESMVDKAPEAMGDLVFIYQKWFELLHWHGKDIDGVRNRMNQGPPTQFDGGISIFL